MASSIHLHTGMKILIFFHQYDSWYTLVGTTSTHLEVNKPEWIIVGVFDIIVIMNSLTNGHTKLKSMQAS